MGSGLIWAGIGKGIADAGSTYGSMLFKSAEAEADDERAIKKAEALEKLKLKLEEDRATRDAVKAVEIDARATQVGEQRAATRMASDVSKLSANAQDMAGASPAATPEEMEAHLKSLTPEQRNLVAKTGLVGRAVTRNEERIASADDSIAAARDLGASSSVLKSYQDAKRSVLDEIKEENRDRRSAEAEEGRDRRAAASEERRAREFQALLPVRQQQADAASTRAERGGSSSDKPATTADIQRQVTAAQNGLATELGVSKNDVNAEIASLKKRADAGNAKAKETLSRIQPMVEEYNAANRRMLDFKRTSSGVSSGSGDNQSSRPPLSSFMR